MIDYYMHMQLLYVFTNSINSYYNCQMRENFVVISKSFNYAVTGKKYFVKGELYCRGNDMTFVNVVIKIV